MKNERRSTRRRQREKGQPRYSTGLRPENDMRSKARGRRGRPSQLRHPLAAWYEAERLSRRKSAEKSATQGEVPAGLDAEASMTAGGEGPGSALEANFEHKRGASKRDQADSAENGRPGLRQGAAPPQGSASSGAVPRSIEGSASQEWQRRIEDRARQEDRGPDAEFGLPEEPVGSTRKRDAAPQGCTSIGAAPQSIEGSASQGWQERTEGQASPDDRGLDIEFDLPEEPVGSPRRCDEVATRAECSAREWAGALDEVEFHLDHPGSTGTDAESRRGETEAVPGDGLERCCSSIAVRVGAPVGESPHTGQGESRGTESRSADNNNYDMRDSLAVMIITIAGLVLGQIEGWQWIWQYPLVFFAYCAGQRSVHEAMSSGAEKGG